METNDIFVLGTLALAAGAGYLALRGEALLAAACIIAAFLVISTPM